MNVISIIVSVKGEMIFTSSYGGRSVYHAVSSTVTFTWGFSGGVGTVRWGIKNDANLNDINIVLVYLLASTGAETSVKLPHPYIGHVSGTYHGNASSGRAIFTLSNITNEHEAIYGCKIRSADAKGVLKVDFVQLIVEGG